MEKYNGKSNSQQMPSFLQAIGAIPGAPRQSGASSMRSSQISGINQSSTSSFHPQVSSSRPISSTPSLAHHQLPSDSTLQGGKTVHHMGQSGISKIKTKDPPVVKIEVGLNPTNLKKQRRSSSGGDGPMRSGSDSTSSDFVFPPVKKIKLEIGDAGVWETKKEVVEVSPTNSSGAVGGVVAPVGNEKTDEDDEDDDGCPVDYKSRCVILIEEEMQNIVKDFKACTTELFFLENDGNILDYHDWSKKSNSSLDDYIDQLAAKHEMTIKGFESEEARVFTSGSGTLPTITPVVISKKLPPAIAAYNSLQQKQNQQNESTVIISPGGIPLSTTAATTTIGSPTPLNSSENAPGSSRVATVTMGTVNHQGGLVRPIPIVAVPSSAAGLLTSKSYADPMSISQSSSSSIVTTPIISSVIPSQTPVEDNRQLAEQVDDEPLEAMVVSRVEELRRQGLWSMSRLPKVVEPERSKGHWDLLLAEMEWMAVDFALERRWKMASSGMIARSVIRSEAVAKRKTRRRKEEERKKELASGVSRIVEEFWTNAQEEFLLKNHMEVDKERKEVLESIIVSAAKDLLEAEKNLVSNIDPSLYQVSDLGESDAHEQEVRELLTSAEWPMDSVLRQYYPKLFEETFHNKGADNDHERTNSNLLEISDDEISEMQEQWDDLPFAKNKYESVDDFLLDIPMVDEAESLIMPENSLFVGDINFRPYQVAGCSRLNKFHQRGVTCVEVKDEGLGTKLQIAFHVSSLASNLRDWGCHLVVIKQRADLYAWHSTFAKVAPSMKVKVTVDESRDWDEDVDLKYSLKDAVENFNVLVTHASHFEQHSEIYQRYKWKTVVIDKVIDLNLPKNVIVSYLNHINYKHLIVFIDASSTPSDILSLVTDDDDDGKMEVSSIQSESWMELVTLTLKDKICDSNPDWMGNMPALEDKNKPNLHLSMDEAIKVFGSLTTCTRRGQVLEQLNVLNVLTLACPLPVKQALKYNEIFAQLLEESPDVTSKKFVKQINELYNTCAHLDDFQSDQSHSSSLHMVSPLTSDPHPSSLELLAEKVDDKDLSNQLKNLLTLYSWGAGLIDQIDKKENNLSTNQTEDFPFNLDLLKSLADCSTNHTGTSHLDKLNSLKQIIAEVDESKILDALPDDVAKSFRNVLFLMQPSSQRGSSLRSFQFEVKEEVMDYSYGDEMVENGEHNNEEEVFEELGSECLKELTGVGRKCFEEEFKKFLMSCRMVVAQLSEHLSKKQSDWSSTKQLIIPLVKSRDDLTNEIKGLDHVDRKIIGRDKGKLSSLSLLLERLTSKGQRFVILTCHRSTTFELQSFFSSKGIAYVSIDSGAKANKVRRSIEKFNSSLKYDCLVMHHSSTTWKSFMRVLGPDFLPSATNLVVLDEELADDNGGGLLWQLLSRRMCSSRDLNLIRLYHLGSVEGYQVQLRWAEDVVAAMVQGRGFNARLKNIDRQWSDGKEFLDTDNRMGDDDDDCFVKLDGNENGEGLEFIYTSHQEALKHSPGGVMTRHCSCLDEHSDDDDDDDGDDSKLFVLGEKQKEIHSYAVSVMNRQLKSSEMMLRREGRSSGRVNIRKLFDLKDDIINEVNDPSVYEAHAYDDLLTYEVDYSDPECFISDLTGEKMPVWAPPTPPHDDDIYVDRNLLLLYESTPMSETQLPSVYMRKGNKRMKMDESGRSTKSSREFKADASGMQRPKSLFERPLNPAQTNAVAVSTANSFAFGFHVDRDGRLINKAGIPVGQPYARSPTVPLPVPRPETQDQFDWLIHEDWALLQAYQMTCLDYNLQIESASPNHPPPQSRLPNWELIACIINGFSRVFRSARQSRLRYENVIVPREEGRSQFDNAQRKLKKTSKGLYKTSKCSRQLKTIQMYSQDNNRSLTTHLSHRFDLLKNALGKINCHKTTVPAPLVKTNHSAIMAENNINYDQPLSALSIAEMKLERASKEKEKRAVVAPDRIQQTPPISTPSTPLVNVLAIQQQQQQQTSSEGSASTPLSTSLTVPIGGGLSVVLPNSQLRMAVPAVVGSQQQQQVILQAAVAQQQMAIVASAASNSLLGKVPLVSGVGNTMPAVRNLTNLSFVVNQSAAANQQNTTFVTVSKAPGTVASTVGIVTSLSPATLKAIRNINPAAANQLVSTINIGQNKAMPPGTAFPPGRIAIRGAGTIQLNQRLTQKPATPQQQVTLTPGNNLAGIQKVSSLGVVSVPTTQMGQTFHVKNPQVLLKQKQQPTGAQQLTGSTVVSRLAAGSTNQGTALQLQHLQLQSKTPQLLEVMQASSAQQQILAANLSSAQVSGINVTALIKTVSANSNLGKAVTPAQTAIRQTHMAKRPTVTAINIQGQGNRTALMGIQQVAKGSSQVIYQQPKLVLQPQSVVKQQTGVQLQQGTAILAMTPRGPAVNISALGLGSTITTGNGMAIPINPSSLTPASSQHVRVAKQMINSPKVAPMVQHITVRGPAQQLVTTPVTIATSGTVIRPQQNPSSSA